MNKKSQETPKYLEINDNFQRNIQALYVFNKVIGSFADEHDKTIHKSFEENLKKLLSPIEQETNNKKLSKKGKKELAKLLNSRVLEKEMKKIRKNAPIQGSLLRKSSLISLMASFETFISQIIQYHYQKFPKAFSSNSDKLSLEKIRELGSLEEAEQLLISNEIDSLLRGNIQSQLEYFEKQLNIDLKPVQSYIEDLIEMSQRRNLLVHNDGIINKQYLLKTPKKHLHKIKEGDKISINQEYLLNAIKLINTVCIILFQQCFRKWEKDSINNFNEILINIFYEALLEEDYNLIENLYNYIDSIDIKNDKEKRILVINYCISLKEENKIDKMNDVIDQYDWSATSTDFNMALSILQNENKQAYRYIKQLLASNNLNKDTLREWPIFKPLREKKKFKKIIS